MSIYSIKIHFFILKLKKAIISIMDTTNNNSNLNNYQQIFFFRIKLKIQIKITKFEKKMQVN